MVKLFHRLMRVSSQLENTGLVMRATLLQYMLWARGAVLFLFFALMGVHDESLIGAIAINFAAIVLGKTKRFQIGAWIVILEISAFIPVVAIHATNDSTARYVVPIWLSFSPILASLVLSAKETLVASGLAVLCMMSILHFSPFGNDDVLKAIAISVVGISGLALLSVSIREKFEAALELERAKLTHSSKLASLGQMAAGVAHELNTPLAAIVVSTEMIEEQLIAGVKNADQLRNQTRLIFNVADRMERIIKGLKTFSRDASEEPKYSVQVLDWVKASLRLCEERMKAEGISLSLDQARLESVCEAQPVQLSQALLNLLTNAGEAIAALPERWIRVAVQENGAWLEISVTDSGHGIARDIARNMFDPFYSTKDYGRGIGLGLSVSHEVLQRHGGELIYDRRSPNTKFVMRLPRPPVHADKGLGAAS